MSNDLYVTVMTPYVCKKTGTTQYVKTQVTKAAWETIEGRKQVGIQTKEFLKALDGEQE